MGNFDDDFQEWEWLDHDVWENDGNTDYGRSKAGCWEALLLIVMLLLAANFLCVSISGG